MRPNRPQKKKLYLPTHIGDMRVVQEFTCDYLSEGLLYLVYNSKLHGTGWGLEYRLTKEMGNRSDNVFQPWGTVVEGFCSGGWLEVVS